MKKKILFGFLIAYGLFIAFANLRSQNPSMDLSPIDLKTYQFASLSQEEAKAIRSNLMSEPGITAVSANIKNGLVGVSYQYEELSENELFNMVSKNSIHSVTEKTFPTDNRPQCPVGGVLEAWERALTFHRFH